MYQIIDNLLIINLDILKGFLIINYMSFMLLGELVLILLLIMLLKKNKSKKNKPKKKKKTLTNNKPW